MQYLCIFGSVKSGLLVSMPKGVKFQIDNCCYEGKGYFLLKKVGKRYCIIQMVNQ